MIRALIGKCMLIQVEEAPLESRPPLEPPHSALRTADLK